MAGENGPERRRATAIKGCQFEAGVEVDSRPAEKHEAAKKEKQRDPKAWRNPDGTLCQEQLLNRILSCQDFIGWRAAHTDGVGNADALIRVARHVQTGNLRETGVQF